MAILRRLIGCDRERLLVRRGGIVPTRITTLCITRKHHVDLRFVTQPSFLRSHRHHTPTHGEDWITYEMWASCPDTRRSSQQTHQD